MVIFFLQNETACIFSENDAKSLLKAYQKHRSKIYPHFQNHKKKLQMQKKYV